MRTLPPIIEHTVWINHKFCLECLPIPWIQKPQRLIMRLFSLINMRVQKRHVPVCLTVDGQMGNVQAMQLLHSKYNLLSKILHCARCVWYFFILLPEIFLHHQQKTILQAPATISQFPRTLTHHFSQLRLLPTINVRLADIVRLMEMRACWIAFQLFLVVTVSRGRGISWKIFTEFV